MCLGHISLRRVRNSSDFADFVAALLACVVNVPHENGAPRSSSLTARASGCPSIRTTWGPLFDELEELGAACAKGPVHPAGAAQRQLLEQKLGGRACSAGNPCLPWTATGLTATGRRSILPPKSGAWLSHRPDVPARRGVGNARVDEDFLSTRARTLEENAE